MHREDLMHLARLPGTRNENLLHNIILIDLPLESFKYYESQTYMESATRQRLEKLDQYNTPPQSRMDTCT